MSIHYGAYVGPYLAVPHAVQRVDGPLLVQCIGNANHAVDKNMKFCPHCGQRVTVTKREDLKPASIRVYDLGDAGDLLWRPEGVEIKDADGVRYDVWISNNTTDVGGQYADMENGTVISTLDNSDLFNKDIIKFQAAVSHIIKEIENQYGVAATVRHGIVPYWS